MNLINKLLFYLTIFLSTLILTSSVSCTEFYIYNQNVKEIKIAQYPHYASCDKLIDLIYRYTWTSNGTIYKFNCTELTLEEIIGRGELPLNNENFDLLVVGASFDSFYKDAKDQRIKEKIKEFLLKGGGYIGVCAGTVFATQGYENPNKIYKKFINNRVLKIADVYLNCDLNGEAQYIFKLGRITRVNQGLVPIEKRVVRNNSIPIFSEYSLEVINISYGGGPGMYVANANDPNLGIVIPLLIINEELMETKPIHWYLKGFMPFIWWKFLKVKTDIYGLYGCIATTYGKGKCVIFTGHPEIQLYQNGTIDEYPGKSTHYGFRFSPYRIVYSWTGTPINMSHNWWIHRRAAAWIVGVPDEDLPPCNELMVFMNKPHFRFGPQLYIKDQQLGSYFNFSLLGEFFNFHWLKSSFLMKRVVGKFISKRLLNVVKNEGKTIIIGDITVEASAENSDIVEFYFDGKLEYIDTERPFKWKLDKNNLNGVHRIDLRAYDEYGNYACEGSEFLFYNT